MLFAASGLIGRPVAASDGRIGAVGDFLVDDRRWDVRWVVVDTGQWLPGRKILIHPSAVAPIRLPPKPALPMLSFGDEMAVSVNLTVREVEASPDAREDEPVTEELERRLFDHYGWDPSWSALASLNEPAILAEGEAPDATAAIGASAAPRPSRGSPSTARTGRSGRSTTCCSTTSAGRSAISSWRRAAGCTESWSRFQSTR